MKQFTFVIGPALVLTAILFGAGAGRAQTEIQTKGKVCPNPSSPCTKKAPNVAKVFEDADLTFKLPGKLTWQRNYYSASFYAIVLKSRPAVVDKNRASESVCSQGYYSDEEVKDAQKLFPTRKVFATRNGCAGYLVGYTNVFEGSQPTEILAVYAGNTDAEAKRTLRSVRANKDFAGATFRKMQVVLGYGD